jgi:hypothetical protein
LSVNVETNLLRLVSPGLDNFYQITIKSAKELFLKNTVWQWTVTAPPGIDVLPVPAAPVKVSTGQFLTKPDDSLLVGGTVIACFLG